MNKKAATLLGIGLSALGPALVLFTGFMFQLEPVPFILMIIGAGLIGLGARVSTIAKTMNGPENDSPSLRMPYNSYSPEGTFNSVAGVEAQNHDIHRSRACMVLQMQTSISRLGDVRRYPN